jgi:hypothetical protein
MLTINFGVAISKNKEAVKLGDTPGKKLYEIHGGFICPMYILNYNEGRFFLIFQLM